MKRDITILFFFFFSTIVLAAPQPVVRCAQWEVIDISFALKKQPAKPFEVEFGALFTHETGQTLRVPGFYNDSSRWVLRFSSSLTGEWTYVTQSSDPALAGHTGKVAVKPNTRANRHGALSVSHDNVQRFAYEDGTPCFLLAFEFDWLFALDLGNHILAKSAPVVEYIARNRFNHIVMNVYAHDVRWPRDPDLNPEYDYANPKIWPFGGTNDKPDFSTLNVDFFRHLDRIVALLHENEIVAHLMIYVWNKQVNWPPMYSKADNMYFDYVVKRYQAYPNVVWDIAKEALDYGRCDSEYILDRIARVRALDGHRRLLSVHDYLFCAQYPQLVDFVSVQSWKSDLNSVMSEIARKHNDRPVFNIEHGGYEEAPYRVFPGDYVDPVRCLERNYECVFAGVYSTYYWQNTSWNVVIPRPWELPAAMQPKIEYYKYLQKLFSDYDFSQLTPKTPLSGGYLLAAGDSLQMILVHHDTYAVHSSFPKTETGRIRVKWFHPLTGQYTAEQEIDCRPWQEFVSPIKDSFSVLIISR